MNATPRHSGHGAPMTITDEEGDRHPAWTACDGHETEWVEYPCKLLSTMAGVYADHHDYAQTRAPR